MKPTCLLISYVWPEPQSSAAGLRDVHLIDALRQVGYEVCVASAANNEIGRSFCEKHYSVRPILLNDDSFDRWLGETQPDLVIFDRFVVEEQFGWRVRSSSPRSVCILDTQDLHFLRLSREKRFREYQSSKIWSRVDSSPFLDSWDDDLVCRELSSIYRVDLAWVLSSVEKNLLIEKFGIDSDRIGLSRFAYPELGSARLSDEHLFREFQTRRGFAMVGNFRHAPNLDAFRWLRQTLWPEVRRVLPAAEVHLYGAYPPKEVMEAHAPGFGFFVHGPAADLKQVFLGRRVSLAPLRFGAGIKGKITDSWWHGIPVVSSSLGAEGMGERDYWGGLIADEAQTFVQACLRLHEDFESWKASLLRGREILQRDFSTSRFLSDLKESLERAYAAHEHRNADWVRQILNHSTVHSYRYFGKWIEEKNRKVLGS